MKIMGTDGAFYGGNEPHSAGKPGSMKRETAGSTVGRSTKYSRDGQNRLVHPNKGDYMAVFKKVKVIGPVKQLKSMAESYDSPYISEKNIRMIVRELLIKEADLAGGLEFSMPGEEYSDSSSSDKDSLSLGSGDAGTVGFKDYGKGSSISGINPGDSWQKKTLFWCYCERWKI